MWEGGESRKELKTWQSSAFHWQVQFCEAEDLKLWWEVIELYVSMEFKNVS